MFLEFIGYTNNKFQFCPYDKLEFYIPDLTGRCTRPAMAVAVFRIMQMLCPLLDT